MYYINVINEAYRKYSEIGERIKEAREKEGLTQSELATSLGYKSPTYISLIEDGKRRVRIHDLEKISKLLHRDVDYFIKGTANKVPDVKIALRSDLHLDQEDIVRVEDFIEALKLTKRKHGRRDSGSQ